MAGTITVRPSPADHVTIANGVCGFVGIALALHAALGSQAGALSDDLLRPCVLLYVLGVIFDLVDGPIARRMGSSPLGATLDTISDVITFAVFPSVLVVARMDGDAQQLAATAGCAAFVAAAILRLARHGALEADERAMARADSREPQKPPFQGMPTPIGANCMIAVAGLAPPGLVAAAVAVLLAMLLISRFPFPDSSFLGGLYVTGFVIAGLAAFAGLIPFGPPAIALLATLIPTALLSAARARFAR